MSSSIELNSDSQNQLQSKIEADLDLLKTVDAQLFTDCFNDLKKILEALILLIIMNMSPSGHNPAVAKMLNDLLSSIGNEVDLAFGLKTVIQWVQDNPDTWSPEVLQLLDQLKQALTSQQLN